MTLGKILLSILSLALLTGCGGGGSSSASGSGGTTPPSTVNNVIPITVNGSLCSSSSYPNKPCVSVTVCTPGTSTCQTINDILLDSGSTGLRIFKQALNVPLAQVSGSNGSLAECIQYADGSSDWGPVQIASVILGNEPAVQVPIQVIDSTFGTVPIACGNAEKSPTDAGFNGILGVAFFAQDCGAVCSNSADNGMYYACSGANCLGNTISLSSQVQNPVALLPQDNNGVIVQLPSVPLSGSPSVDGKLLLGIGTQSNNAPSVVTTYAADELGEFITTFNGVFYSSFIDTGTNGLFFPPPSATLLPDCVFPNSDWFCPSSNVNLSATDTSATGSPSGIVSFQIGNFVSLVDSSNNVFANIGGKSFVDFEWGLPFFFGRNVYIGIEGKKSSLGSGLYWAY
ncbi:Ig domain protein group 2 domain protein (fragment) [Candidatus Sulfobium mesophilum]|uniref:Ig domain protein group 2 domain protein n=1 Tax=Candidatus Sulfobium mesophilum TaxID=2016548 RepID=A0A2U3QKN3_9BACT